MYNIKTGRLFLWETYQLCQKSKDFELKQIPYKYGCCGGKIKKKLPLALRVWKEYESGRFLK
jgi:hypothetical protein